MTFEQIVGEALHAADSFQPSPDLFVKVQRSIEEDAAHRRRVRRIGIWATAAFLTVITYLATTVEVAAGTAEQPLMDRVRMSFTSLEVLVTAVMVGLVLVLGPTIRRFGEAYEREVFRSDPEVGTAVLRLLDVAYHLIFGAYIIMSLVFDPALEMGGGLADWLRGELIRVGGLLLLMGLLHVALVVALPIVGVVFAANERRIRMSDGLPSTDGALATVDKVVTVVAWILGAVLALNIISAVLNGLFLLGASG